MEAYDCLIISCLDRIGIDHESDSSIEQELIIQYHELSILLSINLIKAYKQDRAIFDYIVKVAAGSAHILRAVDFSGSMISKTDIHPPGNGMPRSWNANTHWGLICFSSHFDETAVDFLEELDAAAYKLANLENNHLPLIAKAAATRKPLIIST